MTAMAPITAANPSLEEMEARVARFAALRPTGDYVDAGIPGCERTTYRVLGTPPDAPLEAADFHLNLVCCEPGKSAPLHNHLTQEVFMALSGTWEVFWGPDGGRSLRLQRWDTISIPPGVSRGFRNASSVHWPRIRAISTSVATRVAVAAAGGPKVTGIRRSGAAWLSLRNLPTCSSSSERPRPKCCRTTASLTSG